MEIETAAAAPAAALLAATRISQAVLATAAAFAYLSEHLPASLPILDKPAFRVHCALDLIPESVRNGISTGKLFAEQLAELLAAAEEIHTIGRSAAAAGASEQYPEVHLEPDELAPIADGINFNIRTFARIVARAAPVCDCIADLIGKAQESLATAAANVSSYNYQAPAPHALATIVSSIASAAAAVALASNGALSAAATSLAADALDVLDGIAEILSDITYLS